MNGHRSRGSAIRPGRRPRRRRRRGRTRGGGRGLAAAGAEAGVAFAGAEVLAVFLGGHPQAGGQAARLDGVIDQAHRQQGQADAEGGGEQARRRRRRRPPRCRRPRRGAASRPSIVRQARNQQHEGLDQRPGGAAEPVERRSTGGSRAEPGEVGHRQGRHEEAADLDLMGDAVAASTGTARMQGRRSGHRRDRPADQPEEGGRSAIGGPSRGWRNERDRPPARSSPQAARLDGRRQQADGGGQLAAAGDLAALAGLAEPPGRGVDRAIIGHGLTRGSGETGRY